MSDEPAVRVWIEQKLCSGDGLCVRYARLGVARRHPAPGTRTPVNLFHPDRDRKPDAASVPPR